MKNLVLICFAVLLFMSLEAQQEAEIRSDGILLPRHNIPPSGQYGLLHYNTLTSDLQYHDGSKWRRLNPGILENETGETEVRITSNSNSDFIDFQIDHQIRYRIIENSSDVVRLAIFNTGDNLLLGEQAGQSIGFNSSNLGDNNIAIGKKALELAVTNDNNIAIGNSSLNKVLQNQSSPTVFGNNNVAIGHEALSQTSAQVYQSVAIGHSAGQGGGHNSVFIGNNAGIGTGYADTDHALIIANNSGTPLIYGEFDNQFLAFNGNIRVSGLSGIGIADVQVDAQGDLIRVASDQRLKKDIKTIENSLNKVLALRGVSFNWKDRANENKTLGVIAQEVLDVVPEIVTDNGEYYGVNYSEIPALLIEAIKEQQVIIDQLKNQLQSRDESFSKLVSRMEQLEALSTN